MDVLVCVKRVPAVGAEIRLTEDELGIDTRHLGFTMGPHEECALEEAVRIAERSGGTAGVLTVGPPQAEEQLRYAMSMGAGHAVLVDAGAADPDPEATAAAIAAAARELGSYDSILFGDESADAGHRQVGIRVACELGLPIVGGVKGIEVHGDRLSLRRDVADGVEIYETTLPAAVSVAEGLNLPRYPTVKGRLRAKKAPLHRIEPAVRPGGLRTRRLRRPRETTAETIVLGHGAEAAPAVVDVLEELGVVR